MKISVWRDIYSVVLGYNALAVLAVVLIAFGLLKIAIFIYDWSK